MYQYIRDRFHISAKLNLNFERTVYWIPRILIVFQSLFLLFLHVLVGHYRFALGKISRVRPGLTLTQVILFLKSKHVDLCRDKTAVFLKAILIQT